MTNGNAVDMFWYHASVGWMIPALVPLISHGQRVGGVAATAYPFMGRDEAMALTMSSDFRDRAVAAILACTQLYNGLGRESAGEYSTP